MSGSVSSAVVANSNLVSFVNGLSAQERDDVLDLLMYADFFATQSFRQTSQWTSWLGYYRQQLERSGCQLQSLLVSPPTVIKSRAQLQGVDIAVKGTIAADNLLGMVRRSLRTAALDQYAGHFFQAGTGDGSISAFQVVPCEKTSNAEIQILLCGLYASAHAEERNRGGHRWTDRDMVIRLAGGVYVFNTQVYSEHRARIRSKLRLTANFTIQRIEI
jgi:hypothetical protein